MTFVAQARVATTNAARYAAQLGKHWAHQLVVEERGDDRIVRFPRDARGADWPGDALVTFSPTTKELICRIEATASGQRDGLKGAVERHLDRFAFRELPLAYDWVGE